MTAENPNMPERIAAIQQELAGLSRCMGELLTESRHNGNTLAAVQRGQETMADRLRVVEHTIAGMGNINDRFAGVSTRGDALENRIRALEMANAGTQVVNSGVTATARDVLRYVVLGGACGFLGWLASSALGGA